MGSGALVLVRSHPSFSCVAILLNPPFLIPTIRLSPVPCPTAHLPPHETCPHRPHTPPPPPPSVSPHNFPLGRPKSLPFPPIVLNRWDLPCRRKRGEISDARFRRPVSCDRMLGSTIARRRWRWEGPNLLGRQVASRNSTRKGQKEGCNTRTS